MKTNILIIHGGAPTAVINGSLYGAVTEAARHPEIDHIWGARGGSLAAVRNEFVDLGSVPDDKLRLLLHSPSSAIGTSRDQLGEEEYRAMADSVIRNRIGIVCYNGGNGSMEACGRLYEACREKQYGVRVIGIPKTIDNDIEVTDHAPGYGSAARYIAQSTADVCCDVRGLPIHISVLEAMGRSAGWIAAASSLAEDCGTGGPDLIYMPERDFDEDAFLNDVRKLIDRKGRGVVVASEGLHGKDGEPIVSPVFRSGRATYFGDVSAHLAGLIIRRLGYKARSEKPGICGRASVCLQSRTDLEEAVQAGKEAVKAAVGGENGVMVGFRQLPDNASCAETFLIPIEKVMLRERKPPDRYINAAGNGVTEEFRNWCRPLIGDPLTQYISFQ